MRKFNSGVTAALVATLLFLTVGHAEARINPHSVPVVWDKLVRAANLVDAGPVNLEDKNEPNAWVSFRLNKYSVHATTGLLNTLRNEDELSGILAHEIGHIKLGHYNETVKRSLLWTLLYKGLGEKTIGGIDVLGAGLVLAEAGLSREEEIEADDYGIALAAKAGYDPWGLYNAFLSMQKPGSHTSPSGFNSHPPTERRLVHIKATTEQVEKNLLKQQSN